MAWFWWVIAAFALGVGELFTLDLVFATLVVAALGGSAVALAGGPFWSQAVVAVVLAAGLLALARPRVLARLRAQQEMIPSGTAALSGRTAVVLSAVDDLGGRVKLSGEEWSARCGSGTTLAIGSRVRVVAIDGATAVVEAAPARDGAQDRSPESTDRPPHAALPDGDEI